MFTKTYREDLKWQWGREVAFLRRLEDLGLKLFPRIVKTAEYEITMSWIGDRLAGYKPGEVSIVRVEMDLAVILASLKRAGIKHRDITEHNLLWNEDTGLHLCDFGWSIWDWEPDTPIPPPEVMQPTMYLTDQERARRTLRKFKGLPAEE